MADNVAEATTLGLQHVEAPFRPRRHLPDVLGREFRRGRKAVAQILVALAEDLKVERQDQRRALGGLCPVDQVVDEVAVLHHVELEPEGARGDGGDILDRADAHGRKGEGNAELFGGFGRQHLTIGVLHAGEARWRECDRHRDLLANHLRFQRTIGHIHQHALTQLYLLKIVLIGAVSAFGPCAAIGIVEEHFRHATLRLFLQVCDGEDFAHG